MSKLKYFYNESTGHFTEISVSVWGRWKTAIAMILVGFALALVFLLIRRGGTEFSDERKLKAEIKEMEINYEKLDRQLATLNQVMASIENRDDQVYRLVFGTEPIDQSVRKAGIGGADRYLEIRDKRLAHSDLIIAMYSKVDRLRRKLYVESISQDQLLELAVDKRKAFSCMPSIQPVSNRELIAVASGFGMRYHPFYRAVAKHSGIDFAASEGSPVFATADGEILATDTAVYGYGKLIVIAHGNGYVTRYAHLHSFKVKPGKLVKRGEQIGFVGNTGLSTAPHLHYEVLVNGIQVNPVNYFFRDLNTREYEKIVQLASSQNQSMGN